MQILPNALAPLATRRQFIVYRLVPKADKPGKTDKLPIDYRTAAVHDAHEAAIWTDAPTAIAAASAFGPGYGVGFVFTADDPFFFLDMDNCLLPDGSGWSLLALELLAMLPGAAVEVSSSGRGLHVFGTGAIPPHGCKNVALGLELYHEGRFAALTGFNAIGSAATDCTVGLSALVSRYFAGGPAAMPDFQWTDRPAPEWYGPEDDDVLIQRALRSQSAAAAFNTGHAGFADLWEANVEVLARAYPDADRAYDASSADRALAQHLAFWTGKDCDRIVRLMQRSALARDKWDREDYLPRTVASAVAVQRDVLQDKRPDMPATGNEVELQSMPTARLVQGATFLTIEQQLDLFRGCVYVVDQHKAVVPGGRLLKPDQFRVFFGGFSFPMDPANERTSRDAWEAFTQSQAIRVPKADSTCFKPDRPAGELVQDAGRLRVNTWWPVDVPRVKGDPTPFLRHLEKLLPDERDRTIILSYMAAVVQYKGVKFKWAPLIQGVEGNGKSLLSLCVAHAVGARYVHWPRADQLVEKFNSWLFDKIFIAVEDIYIPEQQREIIEILKPMITGENLEKRAMHTDQVSADLCCNFILNSNHKDAVRKTTNDRRFAIFYTAQQSVDDLARDGLDVDNLSWLYNVWLKQQDGYAIVSDYLHTYDIAPEFNPAGACQRAPRTSSTEEAVIVSIGTVEQHVLEAVAQGLPGFCDGWVSSMALDRLLEHLRLGNRVPPSKRRALLQTLGYDYHPGLSDGRVTSMVLPDGGKPRLYVKADHPIRGLTGCLEIARAYSTAQQSA